MLTSGAKSRALSLFPPLRRPHVEWFHRSSPVEVSTSGRPSRRHAVLHGIAIALGSRTGPAAASPQLAGGVVRAGPTRSHAALFAFARECAMQPSSTYALRSWGSGKASTSTAAWRPSRRRLAISLPRSPERLSCGKSRASWS
eukprot:scaffold9353_cov31-Tisochrysis_lutea.AAC.1